MLKVADLDVTDDEATSSLAAYARKYEETVHYYDCAGDTTPRAGGSDGVVLADVGRLVIINARLSANDVVELLRPTSPLLWADVPIDANFIDLPDDPRESGLYAAACALYEAYNSRPGLKAAKVTKLLHLKRPGLIPIVDSFVKKTYGSSAKRVAAGFGAPHVMFWAAIWRDARSKADQLDRIREELRGMGEAEARVAGLPLLRLQDILSWMCAS